MGGGQYRTHRFAGRVVALLAHHRLEDNLRVFRRVFHRGVGCHFAFGIERILVGIRAVVAVDTHPVHFAAVNHLLLAYYGGVVFGLATHHARAAANARVQVDGHTPVVVIVLVVLPHRHFVGCFQPVRRRNLLVLRYLFGVFYVVYQRILLHHRAAVHQRLVGLGLGDGRGSAGFLQRHHVVVLDTPIGRHGQWRSVLAYFVARLARHCAAVAKGDTHRAVGLAGLNEHGQLNAVAVSGYFQHIALLPLLLDGHFARHSHVVAPGRFRNRIGQLLQKGIVGFGAGGTQAAFLV